VREDGRPWQDKLISDRGLPKGAADLVVTIEVDMHSRSFCIRLRPEYMDGTFSGGNNIFRGLGDWWPRWWDPNLQWIRDGVPTDRTIQFDFEEPLVFVKRAVRNSEGKLEGYMFWVEDYESSVTHRKKSPHNNMMN
jgi:hypothetical protein